MKKTAKKNTRFGFGWMPDLPDTRDRLCSAPLAKLRVLPTKADLRRHCPRVYNQGDIGSCTANAIAAAIEFDRKKQKLRDFIPSRLFIYYNERSIERSVPLDNGAQIREDWKSTRLNSSHSQISYAVFCLKKKKTHRWLLTKFTMACFADTGHPVATFSNPPTFCPLTHSMPIPTHYSIHAHAILRSPTLCIASRAFSSCCSHAGALSVCCPQFSSVTSRVHRRLLLPLGL